MRGAVNGRPITTLANRAVRATMTSAYGGLMGHNRFILGADKE